MRCRNPCQAECFASFELRMVNAALKRVWLPMTSGTWHKAVFVRPSCKPSVVKQISSQFHTFGCHWIVPGNIKGIREIRDTYLVWSRSPPRRCISFWNARRHIRQRKRKTTHGDYRQHITPVFVYSFQTNMPPTIRYFFVWGWIKIFKLHQTVQYQSAS